MNKALKFIEKGHLKQFKELHKKDKQNNCLDKNGFHYIHYACIEGQIEIIDFLIANGTSFDLKSRDGYSPIVYAILNGHVDVIMYFLNHGYLSQNFNGFLALITAAGNNQLEILELLINTGLDINQKDHNGHSFSPLHYAAQEGHLEIVQFLLKKGAEINIIDSEGLSPLRMAADWEHYEIVKYLIDHGADVNIGKSLHNACAWKRFKMVKFLLERDADINEIDDEGQTPIFYAIIAENKKIVSYLLSKGARKEIINKKGKSIFDLCNNPEIRNLLT